MAASPVLAQRSYPSIATLAAVVPLATMPALDGSLRGIAFHEAGHAVLMHLFRLGQNGAAVKSVDGRAEGKVDIDVPRPEAAEVEVALGDLQVAALRIAAMYMAGFAAQMLKDGLPLEGAVLVDAPDWRNAERVLDLGEVPGSATGRIFFCQRFAMAMLARHWTAVEAVAAALEIRGSLSRADIDALCQGERLRYDA